MVERGNDHGVFTALSQDRIRYDSGGRLSALELFAVALVSVDLLRLRALRDRVEELRECGSLITGHTSPSRDCSVETTSRGAPLGPSTTRWSGIRIGTGFAESARSTLARPSSSSSSPAVIRAT